MNRFLLALLLLPTISRAEDMPNNVPQTTAAPANARYELAVSSWMRRLTFRLDRYNGRVWMKVVDLKDNNKLWEAMYVEGHPWSTNSTHPHFQIFLSGVFASDTFLIDTDNGKVWMVVDSSKKTGDATPPEHLMWQLIDEEHALDSPTSPVKP